MTRTKLAVALGLAALLAGGCNKVSKSQYELAVQEAAELRQRNGELEAANAQLQDDLAAREDDSASGKGARATGFDNIGGVDVYHGAGGEIILNMAGDVLFDSGSATLKSTAKRSLDQIASVVNAQYGVNQISVEGHSDTDPIKKSNWKTNERLSAERAMAVESYLVSKGIGAKRIRSVAYGPDRPKGSKKDSRRVEIVILAAAGGE